MSPNSDHVFQSSGFDSAEDAAHSLARKITAQSETAIQQNGRCVWAVSGGSSILKLYDALSLQQNKLIEFGQNLIIIWVDERLVPHDHKRSNYGNAYNYFWNLFESARLIPVPYNRSPEQAAYQYETILEENGIGRGNIDVTILGMGTDGHTASLFPDNVVLNEKERNIVPVVDSSVEDPRISMTFPLINSSKSIYLFYYGAEKAKTMKQAALSRNVDQYPILGIDKNKLVVYSDRIQDLEG